MEAEPVMIVNPKAFLRKAAQGAQAANARLFAAFEIARDDPQHPHRDHLVAVQRALAREHAAVAEMLDLLLDVDAMSEWRRNVGWAP